MQTQTTIQERTKKGRETKEYYLHLDGPYKHDTLRITRGEAIRLIETLGMVHTTESDTETEYSTNKFYR